MNINFSTVGKTNQNNHNKNRSNVAFADNKSKAINSVQEAMDVFVEVMKPEGKRQRVKRVLAPVKVLTEKLVKLIAKGTPEGTETIIVRPKKGAFEQFATSIITPMKNGKVAGETVTLQDTNTETHAATVAKYLSQFEKPKAK